MTGTGAPRGRPKKRGKIWNFRLIRASAGEVGARDLADGTRDDVDVARSGAGRVRLRGVDESPIVLCAMDHGSPDMVPGLVKTGLATWAWCWLPAPWPPVLAASYAATYSSIRIYPWIYPWMYATRMGSSDNRIKLCCLMLVEGVH